MKTTCPQCSEALTIPDDQIGKPVRCTRCRSVFEANPAGAAAAKRIPAPTLNHLALASVVLGLLGLVGWYVPLIGLILSVITLILGILSLQRPGKSMAAVGVALGFLCLIVSIFHTALGAYLVMRGEGLLGD